MLEQLALVLLPRPWHSVATNPTECESVPVRKLEMLVGVVWWCCVSACYATRGAKVISFTEVIPDVTILVQCHVDRNKLHI